MNDAAKTTEALPLSAAIKQFFGYTDNPTLMKDYKALTQEDRAEIRDGLIRNGYNIKPL